MTVKEFWKSANIWQSYEKNLVVYFFGLMVFMILQKSKQQVASVTC